MRQSAGHNKNVSACVSATASALFQLRPFIASCLGVSRRARKRDTVPTVRGPITNPCLLSVCVDIRGAPLGRVAVLAV